MGRRDIFAPHFLFFLHSILPDRIQGQVNGSAALIMILAVCLRLVKAFESFGTEGFFQLRIVCP